MGRPAGEPKRQTTIKLRSDSFTTMEDISTKLKSTWSDAVEHALDRSKMADTLEQKLQSAKDDAEAWKHKARDATTALVSMYIFFRTEHNLTKKLMREMIENGEKNLTISAGHIEHINDETSRYNLLLHNERARDFIADLREALDQHGSALEQGDEILAAVNDAATMIGRLRTLDDENIRALFA